MSMMKKIKSMLKGREAQAAKGIDMAGDMFDRKTHGKYRRHVDKAQSKLKDEFARPEGQGRQGGKGPQPGQGTQPGQGPGGGGYGPQGGQSPSGGQNPYGGSGRPPQR